MKQKLYHFTYICLKCRINNQFRVEVVVKLNEQKSVNVNFTINNNLDKTPIVVKVPYENTTKYMRMNPDVKLMKRTCKENERVGS